MPYHFRARFAAVALLAWPLLAAAQEPPTVTVVLDGSGSMWAKPEGETRAKLVLARDGLRAALATLPPDVRLGLVSFGHRRAGDCSDVEVIVKPEAGTLERVGAVLDKHNPRGRGPITAALREAAKNLGPRSAPSSLILVHDDLDNCQADPCSAIADLQRAHPTVKVHVVSLAMKHEEAQRMSCLTRATGGILAEVANYQQATAAIASILQQAVSARRPATPAPPASSDATPKPAPARPGLKLAASLAAGGEPVAMPLRWRISAAGRSDAAPLFEGDAAAPFLELPPGRYEIEAQLGFVLARTSVEVQAGETRALTMPLGAGLLRLAPGPSSLPSARQAIFTFTSIDPKDGAPTVAMMKGLVPEIALLPGHYRVTAALPGALIERTVKLQAGQSQSLSPLLDLGELETSIRATPDGPPLESASIAIYEDDPDAAQGRREIVRSSASQPVFLLPSGTYTAIARLGAVEQRERVTVRGNERERRTFVLATGRVAIRASLPQNLEAPEAVTLRAERIDAPPHATTVNRASAALDLPAGRYRIETRIGFANARAEREVELRPGAREEVSLEIPAGRLLLRLVDGARGSPLTDVGWDVRDLSGRTIWVGQMPEARPLLLPGRYTARAEYRGRAAAQEVEVRAGEVRAFDLTLPP